MSKTKWIPHIIEEGSREHVISWFGDVGPVCSAPNCEKNRDLKRRKKKARQRVEKIVQEVHDFLPTEEEMASPFRLRQWLERHKELA